MATRGIWLEDLFVLPEQRGAGVGRALLAAVAASVPEAGGRLEWAALDWNELALGFYERLGAERLSAWELHRLSGDALRRVAGLEK
jgi:GNAT superfamily N-acetyltransferase